MAIDGAIGVGKTTLAHLLCRHFEAETLLEDAQNPFLDEFYRDAGSNALQTEIYFLLTRYRQLAGLQPRRSPRRPAISDYAFQRSLIFAELTLKGDERELYRHLYDHFEARLPLPDLVLHLVADTESCMERIRRRSRGYERTLTRSYLAEVVAAYERFYRSWDRTPLLTIDTRDLDFPARPEALEILVDRLTRPVEGTDLLTSPDAAGRVGTH